MHPVSRHSRLVLACFLSIVAALLGCASTATAQTPDSVRLLVYVNGSAIGAEDSAIKRTPEGWLITGTGRLSPPLDLTTRKFSVRYSADWKPAELVIEATSRGAAFSVHTTFDGTVAENDVVQLGQPSHKRDTVSPDTLVLPNLFFAGDEALAMRLAAMPGDAGAFAAYIAPQAEIKLEARRLDVQTIETARGTVRAHRYAVSFFNPGATLPTEVWTDDNGRLMRFEVPSQGLVVIREDISSVTARRQNIARAGDQSITIPANGFNLAGTVSQPKGAPDAKGRFPAIAHVPGSGPSDRDETVYGVPVFGQVAGQLADAGYLVVRYDKRGIGQSGGRAETADLNDYAEDTVAALEYVRRRKDVDPDRVALVGHSEGAWVSMLAAERKGGDVAALVLVAAPATSGGTWCSSSSNTCSARCSSATQRNRRGSPFRSASRRPCSPRATGRTFRPTSASRRIRTGSGRSWRFHRCQCSRSWISRSSSCRASSTSRCRRTTPTRYSRLQRRERRSPQTPQCW